MFKRIYKWLTSIEKDISAEELTEMAYQEVTMYLAGYKFRIGKTNRYLVEFEGLCTLFPEYKRDIMVKVFEKLIREKVIVQDIDNVWVVAP